MVKNIRLTILASCLLAMGTLGCGHQGSPSDTSEPAAPSQTKVSAVQPQRQCLLRAVEQPGSVQADEETHLFARVSGYVSKVHVDIGQKVQGPKYDSEGKVTEPGQILALIAVPELQVEVKQKEAQTRLAKAEVEQARKALAAAQAQIETVKASVDEAKALQARWDSELKRVVKLVESGTLDVQARDEIQNQHKAARARVASSEAAVRKAQADRDKAKADLVAAEARVDVAQAAVQRVEALLAYASVRAPYDGIVTLRQVNTGDSVEPAGGKGDLLFTVAKLDPVRIVVAVPEADAELVHDKADATITIAALRDSARTGVVKRTSWALQSGSRTLRAEIELPNKDGQLRPGMYVYARITGRCAESWTLPTSALAKHGDSRVCYQIQSGKANRLKVQTGRSNGEYTEVLKWRHPGTPSWQDWTGDELIASRSTGLTDGQTVRLDGAGK